MVKMPKLISKEDRFGVGMSMAIGGLTFLLYLCGKLQGRGEAYKHSGEMLLDAVDEVNKNLEQVKN